MSLFAQIFERFVSFRRIPMRIIVITALASYLLQIGAILQGQPLYIIALYTLIPWIPLAFFEGLWKYEHYNWIAIFAIVTALQVGHLGEHIFQVTQIAALNGTQACPPPVDNEANKTLAVQAGLRAADDRATGYSAAKIVMPGGDGKPLLKDGKTTIGPPACGVFGQLDAEWVHLIWDSLVWIGGLWLLTKFPRNIFLWLSMIAASAHEVEHLFLGWIYVLEPKEIFSYMAQMWATTADGNIVTAHPIGKIAAVVNFYEAGGKAGIFAHGGMFDNLTGTSFMPRRAYLHMVYNTLVVLPTVFGFLWQTRKVYDAYLAKALPGLTEEQLIAATPRLTRMNFSPGEVIVRQGDIADTFYIITRGQVDVVREGENGQEIMVTRLGTGQYFGEIGLLHGGKRIATCRAADSVEVLALDRSTFSSLIDESDMSRQELDRIVRQRVLQTRALQSGPG